MNFYVCRKEIRDNLNDEDMKFFRGLSRIAETHHAEDVHSRIGYDVIGPVLLGYSQWLHKEALSLDAPVIMFLAREGQILKRAYDYLYGREGIRTVYVNVSRLSMCRASAVYTHNFADLQALFCTMLNPQKTIRELFSIVGLDENVYRNYSGLDRKIADVDTDELYDFITRNGTAYFFGQNMLLKRYISEWGLSRRRCAMPDTT